MKLFFSPGTCSLSPHIALRESGLPFDLVRVDIRTHKTQDGDDYYQVNPKGSVPVLQLDSGDLLTEGPIISQYIADKAGNRELMPAAGSLERYRVMEWQNYITSELHKSYSVLFNPSIDAASKTIYRGLLRKKYEWLDSKLQGKTFLTGSTFTAADAYLFTVTRWAKAVEVDLSGLSAVEAFMAAVEARPAVKAALETEKTASGKKH
jgi:glutathione S-transferase